MEDDIQEKLEEIYLFDLEVEWVQFRQYRIIGKIKDNLFRIYYTYEANLTLDANIEILIQMIDKEILKVYKKGI